MTLTAGCRRELMEVWKVTVMNLLRFNVYVVIYVVKIQIVFIITNKIIFNYCY